MPKLHRDVAFRTKAADNYACNSDRGKTVWKELQAMWRNRRGNGQCISLIVGGMAKSTPW